VKRALLAIRFCAGAAEAKVTFVSPLDGSQAFGPQAIEITTDAASVDRVDFSVDGVLSGVARKPSYRVAFDFGTSLAARRITVERYVGCTKDAPMSERIPCRKCGRAIDATAGRCPFCNWDQAHVPPPPDKVAVPAQVASYKPPEEMNLRKLVGMAGGFAVMLVLAFLIGMVINRDGAPKKAPETLEEQAQEHNVDNLEQKRADTPLVPAGQGGIEQSPITSAPVAAAPGQTPNDYARTDATAVSADEYAQMAKRAEAERKKNMTVLVDPRSLTGPAYAQGQRMPARRTASLARRPLSSTLPGGSSDGSPRAARNAAVRTRPVPEYQPIPRMNGIGTARFTLMIGTDGRVKDVNVEKLMGGGNTARLVSSIQSWRFKPATENGRAVSAPYSVEISFKP